MWKEMQEDIFENQVFTLSVFFLNCMTARKALAELAREILTAFFLNFATVIRNKFCSYRILKTSDVHIFHTLKKVNSFLLSD